MNTGPGQRAARPVTTVQRMDSSHPSMAGVVHEAPGSTVRLRPVAEDDLAMLRRFAVEPGLIGLDWAGFQDAAAPRTAISATGAVA